MGPRRIVIFRSRPQRVTASSRAVAIAVSSGDSKNPKKTTFSPWNSLWLRSTIAAMRPTSRPPGAPRRAASPRGGRTDSRPGRPSPRRSAAAPPSSDRPRRSGRRRRRSARARACRGRCARWRPRQSSSSLGMEAGPRERQTRTAFTRPTSRPTLSKASSARASWSVGVRRHERRPDQGAAGRRRGRQDAVDEHALLLETVHQAQRRQVLADDDRDDRSLRLAGVEARGIAAPPRRTACSARASRGAPARVSMMSTVARAAAADAGGGAAEKISGRARCLM